MNRAEVLVHAGIAGLIAAAAVTAVTTVSSSAVGGGTRSVYVPIAPCRLADTRSDSTVGGRATPLGTAETYTFQVWGTNGNCTIPTSATGIGTNVTTVNPTAVSYLTVFPADVVRPVASNLNWVPASPPTPNQVTVGLSATGAVSAFNNGGQIDVIIDIVGYYEALPASGNGPTGPAGGTGPAGPAGAAGPAGPVNRITRDQIARLRWDQDPGRAGTYQTGTTPEGVAFDGTSIWVANYLGNTVSKIDPATGTKTDYPTGTKPFGVAYDGISIWVANNGNSIVSKINPATGTKTDYPTGTNPAWVVYDGIGIWVTNFGGDTVSKINPG